MSTLIEAILALDSTAQVSITDENWDTIVWHNIDPLEKSAVLSKKAELESTYTSNAYQRDRASEYPSIEDQLDDLYHNGLDGWKASIKTIKDKYPKG
jgi:hypothetical protein|tara:strand:- start:52 stop:342 length:291 start_codon:yes stop_codon:yes gene_type:complete